MGRIANLKDLATPLTGSGVLKEAEGFLFSVTIAWKGGIAGQELSFKDGVDNNANVIVPIILDASEGTLQLKWANGKKFSTGLFYSEESAADVRMVCSYV